MAEGTTARPARLDSSAPHIPNARSYGDLVDWGQQPDAIEGASRSSGRLSRPALVQQVAVRERLELDRRDTAFRGGRQPIVVRDRTVILVDDGLATGSTMLAAATAVKGANPKAVVVAVPVAAPETCQSLRSHVDDVVCAATPEPFRAVGLWYRDFAQVDDAEVHTLLESRVRDDFPRS